MAGAGVEVQAGHIGGAEDRRAVDADRSQAGPGLGPVRVDPFRQRREVGQRLAQHDLHPPRPDLAVEAGELGHAGDPQPVAEAADHHLVLLVDQRHPRDVGRVRHRQRRRVALDRLQRQPQAQRPRQPRGVDAGRQHVAVGGQRAAVGHHRTDAAGIALDPLHRLAEPQPPAALGQRRAQRPHEAAGIAGAVIREVHAARELLADAGQGRLQLDHAGGIQPHRVHAEPFGRTRLGQRLLQVPRVAEDLQAAAMAGVVVEFQPLVQSVHQCAAVDREPGVDGGDARVVVGAAVAQEPEAPAQQERQPRRSQEQRRLLAPDPAQQLADHRRRVPGVGVPRVQDAAVGVTALGGEFRIAVEQRHLAARLGQVPGRERPRQATADHQHVHAKSSWVVV